MAGWAGFASDQAGAAVTSMTQTTNNDSESFSPAPLDTWGPASSFVA